jgi:hypothetical protein
MISGHQTTLKWRQYAYSPTLPYFKAWKITRSKLLEALIASWEQSATQTLKDFTCTYKVLHGALTGIGM